MTATYQGTRDVPLDELTPFPGNARRGDVEAIRKSLARNGQYRSLIVRDTGGALVVLAGNHTMQALGAEGHDSARCEVVTCTDAEARRINLADNRTSDLATDDPDLLRALLEGLDGDWDGTGYTADDLDLLTSEPPSLDDLGKQFGDPGDDDLWPVLKFKVSPTTRDGFYELTEGLADNDDGRFTGLIERMRALTGSE